MKELLPTKTKTNFDANNLSTLISILKILGWKKANYEMLERNHRSVCGRTSMHTLTPPDSLRLPVRTAITPLYPSCTLAPQITSILAHIPCEQSWDPMVTLCQHFASVVSQNMIAGNHLVWLPRLLIAKLSTFPCQGNCFLCFSISLLTLELTWFQK